MGETMFKAALWAVAGWLTLLAVKEVAYLEGRRGAADVCSCVAAGGAYEATLPEEEPLDLGTTESYSTAWSYSADPVAPRFGAYVDQSLRLHTVIDGVDQWHDLPEVR